MENWNDAQWAGVLREVAAILTALAALVTALKANKQAKVNKGEIERVKEKVDNPEP